MKLSDLKPRVAGHWGAVYAALAPELTQNHRIHQPCPVCGGKDRFRLFKEWQDTGAAICNQCGTGDGLDWVARIAGTDIRGAALAVARIIGQGTPCAPLKPASTMPQPTDYANRRNELRALLAACKPLWPCAPALAYLRTRGLGALIDRDDLPEHWWMVDRLAYWDCRSGKPTCTGMFPALVAPVVDPQGNPVAAHRTWITTNGTKAPVPDPKKLTPPARAEGLAGCAIRLYPLAGDVLAVAEGIETALAIRAARPAMPVWACISANGLRSVQLPVEVRTVYIMADNDHSGAGSRAAHALAERLTHEGRTALVCLPPGPIPPAAKGLDWHDVLTADTRASA